LQDAVNLGWKLAAAVHGWAPDGLLDSYEAERRPVAERVTMSTRAQSVLIGPGSEITALRMLFGELLDIPAVRAHIASLLAGSAGEWAPDLVLHTDSGPVRLAGLTSNARPLLLDLTGTLAEVAAPWRDRVDVVTGKAEGTDATAMLVRPDCYLAWSSTAERPDGQELRDALTRWFGQPACGPGPADR
jgi:hypothetical protein